MFLKQETKRVIVPLVYSYEGEELSVCITRFLGPPFPRIFILIPNKNYKTSRNIFNECSIIPF